MTRSHWRLINLLLWLLAVCLATWTLWQLPLGEILPRLSALNWRQGLLWTLLNCAILYLAVRRWQLLAAAVESPLPLTSLFLLRQAGGAISFITPGPQFGGEPLQLFWLHRNFRLPLHQAAAVLGLDRFMETGVNLAVLLAGVMMLLGTAIMPLESWLQISAILTGTLVILVTAAALLLKHPDWLARRIDRLVGQRQSVSDISDRQSGWLTLVELLRGALAQRSARLWLALGLSLVVWVALLVELAMLLDFLGLSPTFLEVVLIMVGMRLAMLLPMPGGIGTIEASLFWSFSFLALPLSAAAGLIALSRLRDVVLLLIGLGCLAGLRRQPGEPGSATELKDTTGTSD